MMLWKDISYLRLQNMAIFRVSILNSRWRIFARSDSIGNSVRLGSLRKFGGAKHDMSGQISSQPFFLPVGKTPKWW